MFKQIFDGEMFSYFHDNATEQYMLYWHKYELSIFLKDEDASLFRQQIELINSQPDTGIQARIERTIKIYFYFRFAQPMPCFSVP